MPNAVLCSNPCGQLPIYSAHCPTRAFRVSRNIYYIISTYILTSIINHITHMVYI
jgi:hypothetical protein